MNGVVVMNEVLEVTRGDLFRYSFYDDNRKVVAVLNVEKLKEILGAEIICREDLLSTAVSTACGSDMMSDVLAFVKEQAVMLTGLVNPQVVRTAEMMDMHCIVFVRGKRPTLQMIEMAEDRDMVMLCTSLEMFTSCGKLYSAGLRGGSGQ